MGRGVAAQPPRSAGGAGGSEVGTAADEPGAGAKRRSRERKRTDRASGAAPPGEPGEREYTKETQEDRGAPPGTTDGSPTAQPTSSTPTAHKRRR
jgi:hypothetical protein